MTYIAEELLVIAMAKRLIWAHERAYRFRDAIDRTCFFIGCAEFHDARPHDLERLSARAVRYAEMTRRLFPERKEAA